MMRLKIETKIVDAENTCSLMVPMMLMAIQAGAHFVIATTVDLPPVIAEINRRLAMGIKP